VRYRTGTTQNKLFVHIRDLLLRLFRIVIYLIFPVLPVVLVGIFDIGLSVAGIIPVAHLRIFGIVMLHPGRIVLRLGRVVLHPGLIVRRRLLIFLICHMVLF
jgi:hypothetical protein